MFNEATKSICLAKTRSQALAKITTAAALTLGVFAMGAANASQETSYQVSYHKSELTTLAGVNDVHLRIQEVAKDHCPSFSLSRSLNLTRGCIAEVTDDLVNQIDHPELTAVHNHKDT